MNDNMYILNELTEGQRRIFIDAIQLYQSFLEARSQSRKYRGGMIWRKVAGKEYLFHFRDRYGHGKSLGPRSDDTEKIFSNFKLGKEKIKDRLHSLKEKMQEQARFCKAALIQRVPKPAAQLLRVLEQQGILGTKVMVVGTNALYAYEAAAGVYFETSLMATQDMDVLWDVRRKIKLFLDPRLVRPGFIDLLRKVDRSFEFQGYRAVNRHGYMVDLIRSMPSPPWKPEPKKIGAGEDLEAADIRNLHWLLSSPKFSQVVIGSDGLPATMVVPDPRSFAIHKLWLSRQEDREPVKKKRDRSQALAVASLVFQYLPQYPFQAEELRMFPQEVVRQAQQIFMSEESLPGLDWEEL
jgi:hypothetical protein